MQLKVTHSIAGCARATGYAAFINHGSTPKEFPMKYALWIVQFLLAAAFFMAGTMKGFTPAAELAAQMPWTEGNGIIAARIAGIAEIFGAVGLILPSLTRIKPLLTPLAGLGLATVMVLASGMHLLRGEFGMLVPNLVLGGLAVFVAWGRTFKLPIRARG
jgi:hypothetical protein